MMLGPIENLSSKAKLSVTILGGAALLVLAYFLLLKPLVLNLNDLHQQAQKSRNELDKLKIEEESYKRAQAEYDRIQNRVAEIDRLFPVKEELVGIVEDLETAAIASDNTFMLSITDISEAVDTRQKKEEKPYSLVPNLVNISVIPYDFQLEGSFQSVVSFLQTLENQPFYSEIETMTFTSDKSESKSAEKSLSTRSGKVAASIRSAFYAEKKK